MVRIARSEYELFLPQRDTGPADALRYVQAVLARTVKNTSGALAHIAKFEAKARALKVEAAGAAEKASGSNSNDAAPKRLRKNDQAEGNKSGDDRDVRARASSSRQKRNRADGDNRRVRVWAEPSTRKRTRTESGAQPQASSSTDEGTAN